MGLERWGGRVGEALTGQWRKRRQDGGRGQRAQRWVGPGLGNWVQFRRGLGAGQAPRGALHVCALLQDYYYMSVKALYTVGYSTSLVTLTTAMVILCRFR